MMDSDYNSTQFFLQFYLIYIIIAKNESLNLFFTHFIKGIFMTNSMSNDKNDKIALQKQEKADAIAEKEKYIVTWDMLQIFGRSLAKKLLPATQWKGIIAVSRGGLVPAAILARELSIRYVDTICISSYDHDNQREQFILKQAEVENGGEGFLVVDDLVDSGNTAKTIRELYPNAKFVTIFAKPKGLPLVDDYIVDIEQDTWIEQPWDLALSFVKPISG